MTEANHLLDDTGWLSLMRRAAAGRLTLVASDSSELVPMADFTERYADGGTDFVDVALVFAADRLKAYNVLTVDRRDFDRYRTPKGKRLVRSWLAD